MGGALTSLRLRHMTSVCIAAKGPVPGGSQWNAATSWIEKKALHLKADAGPRKECRVCVMI